MGFGLDMSLDLKGADAALKKLARYEADVQRKAIIPVVNRETKCVVSEVRDRLPAFGDTDDSTGTARLSIGRKVKGYKSGVVVCMVGPQVGFKRSVTLGDGREVTRDPVNYMHLYELGTRHSPALRPMKKAWDSVKAKVEAGIVAGIIAEVEKL